jgi:ATP-binding protein involved in chromosome partitioning
MAVTSQISREAVLDALRTVKDPELHRDILSLDMVKDLKVEGGTVSLHFELTTPACPLKATIEEDIKSALGRVPGYEGVVIEWGAKVRATAPREGGKPVAGVKNIIAVASNKGGVGKSTVAANLAVALAATGAKTGLIDADITGPNVPTMFGIEPGFLAGDTGGLRPVEKYGVKVISIGFLLPRGTPVVWRGPMIGSGVRQLLHDVDWGELDYLVIDLPPGTSDASMSMAQEAPIAGAVIVSTPQEVALEDATKAVGMFEKLNVPVFGIVENMSYFVCPHCSGRSEVFGHGGAAEAADDLGLDFLGEVPLTVAVRKSGDEGTPIVAADPESPVAAAFNTIAGKVAAKLSVLQRLGGMAA